MARKGSLTNRRKATQLSLSDNKVISYVRASTDEQKNSLDAQERRHREFAESRNLEIAATFKGEGVSATATDFLERTEVKLMLAHMGKHGIRIILLLRVDRVFRSTRDFNLSMVELEKRGIFLRFIDPDIDYSTPIGRMFIQQQVLMAEYEGQLRGQRQDDVYDSLRDRRVARVANAIPYGWQENGTAAVIARTTGEAKLSLAAIPAEQAILKHLMAAYEADQRYGHWTRLATMMNALGVPTKKGKATWYAATVQSVLEHAVMAEDAEIPGGPITLEAAVAILRRPATAAA